LAAIRDAGIEAAIADPLWPGTVLGLVADVTLVLWLLGSTGPGREELHGERLERLLERLVDTPVRGFLYEAAGSAGVDALAAGRRAVEVAAARWRIPAEVVVADPSDPPSWATEMEAACRRLVS
jgi:hypothetical protein